MSPTVNSKVALKICAVLTEKEALVLIELAGLIEREKFGVSPKRTLIVEMSTEHDHPALNYEVEVRQTGDPARSSGWVEVTQFRHGTKTISSRFEFGQQLDHARIVRTTLSDGLFYCRDVEQACKLIAAGEAVGVIIGETHIAELETLKWQVFTRDKGTVAQATGAALSVINARMAADLVPGCRT